MLRDEPLDNATDDHWFEFEALPLFEAGQHEQVVDDAMEAVGIVVDVVQRLAPGLMVADLVALVGSIDIVLGEVDR